MMATMWQDYYSEVDERPLKLPDGPDYESGQCRLWKFLENEFIFLHHIPGKAVVSKTPVP